MRTALIPTARPLAPFGRPMAACGLGAQTFGDYLCATLRALRLPPASPCAPEVEIVGPALVLADDVFVTRRALRGFLRAARRASGPSRLALPDSRLLRLTLPLQDVPRDTAGRAAFDVAFLPPGVRLRAADALALPEARWLCPPYREVPLTVPLPHHLLGRAPGPLEFPITSCIAMRVRHWLHVLRANHFMPQIALLEHAEAHALRSALRALPAALRPGREARLRALRAAFVVRGRGSFVHPTATVEASMLGEGVIIGAYAYVVGSVIGPGSVIEQRAHVEQSCLGRRTFVSKNSTVSACVAFGDTDVCTNGIQACAIAEGCGLTSWARPLDVVPGGEVQVVDEGRLRSAGELPCGAAFGPGVFVGAEVNIAPGRAIPGGVRLISDPARTLRRLPAEVPPGLYTVVEGALRAVDSDSTPHVAHVNTV